jgi:hypothetical protein
MLSYDVRSRTSLAFSGEQTPDLRSRYPSQPEEQAEILAARLQRTWHSLQLFFQTSSTYFPADRLAVCESEINIYPRTKPTNIGLGILSLLAAEQLGFLPQTETQAQLKQLLDSLAQVERSDGFFYDWYDAHNGEVLLEWPDSGQQLERFLSSVDNAWLALALLITQKAKPELADQIQTEFLSKMDFETFFDPQSEELWGGYSVTKQQHTNYHYSRERLSEPRIIHWVNAALCTDEEKKREILQRLLGKDGEVPHQLAGGALFELLMPRLFIRENYLDETVNDIFRQHLEYGNQHLDGCVGVSVADDPTQHNHYREMGVGGTYPSTTVLSSHGLALALLVQPKIALEAFQKAEQFPGFYTDLGYFDAVDTKTGATTNTQVFIDQAMVFLSFFACLDSSMVELFEQYFSSGPTAPEKTAVSATLR